MPDFIKKAADNIAEYFRELEKGQRARFFVFVALAAIILIIASVYLNQKSYTVLYSGMEASDAGEMLGVLQEMGVDAKVQGSDTILVESQKADTVRMQLAAEGYPKSGFNFDIFSQSSGLGMTDMERRVYYQFQLQDNLSKVIKKMDKVQDAIVNISLAKESAFVLSEDEQPASASVLLQLKSGQSIDTGEVRAIAELVSKSISGLSVEDVRIIDNNMKLYSIDTDDTLSTLDSQLALQQQVKQTLQQQIISLLAPVFGEQSILAEVSVTLDFDTQVTETVEFRPPLEGGTEGLAVSMKELAETIKGDTASAPAGIDPNGANTTVSYPELTSNPDALYNKVSRETNLELNETRTKIENAKGRIRDLSVAVVLDSSAMEDDYTANVRNLVANAIGVAGERVSVEMLPFLRLETVNEDNTLAEAFNTQKDMLSMADRAYTTRLLILVGAAVLVVLILLAAILSLRKRDVMVTPAYEVEIGNMIDYADGEDMLPPVVNENALDAPDDDDVPDIPQKQDSTLAQLGKFVDKSPESAASLLRNWLTEDRN